MNILILSRSPWRKDNSFGNTYSSIFSKLEGVKIANICLSDGMPELEENVSDYFIVSESQVIRSLLPHKSKVGYSLKRHDITSEENSTISETKNKSRLRAPLFYLIRDIVWKFGKIDYESMYHFIDKFKPDIIFMPLYYAQYVSRVALKIKKRYNIPIVLEASIDVYSLKQLSFDPIYWINRFLIRSCIRELIKKSSLLYVISDRMKRDYSKHFNLPIKILYKIPDKNRALNDYEIHDDKLKFVYTGNIGTNRWKVLAKLAKCLKETKIGELAIFTATPINKQMDKALNIKGVSSIKGPVKANEIPLIQSNSDLLVHVEPSDLKSKLLIRYSISTKIMDYLSSRRAIFAIGPKSIASMDLLSENDLAICAETESEIINKLSNLLPHQILEYSSKGEKFLDEHFNEYKLRCNLLSDLRNVTGSHLTCSKQPLIADV